MIVFRLALEQLKRFNLSNQREYLDRAIVHLTETILLPPLSLLQHAPIILHALFLLTDVLLMRSKVIKQPGDAIYATKYLYYLRDQPHEIPNIPRHRVTDLLVQTLALQVKFKVGNVMQNIREMAIFSRELLTMETSDIDTTRLIDFIWEVTLSKIYRGVPDHPLDELIECLRAAMKRRPDLPRARFTFAMSLMNRYRMTQVDDDYEQAMSILNQMATSGSSQDESFYQERATGLAAFLARFRSETHWSPEYLEEAIYHTRAFLSSSSYTKSYSHFAWDLEDTAKERFLYFGSIEGVEESDTGEDTDGSAEETPESDEKIYDKMHIMILTGFHHLWKNRR